MILKCFDLLKEGGTLVYSTCTFAPEENEGVVDFLLRNRPANIERVEIPNFQLVSGITEWEGQVYGIASAASEPAQAGHRSR